MAKTLVSAFVLVLHTGAGPDRKFSECRSDGYQTGAILIGAVNWAFLGFRYLDAYPDRIFCWAILGA